MSHVSKVTRECARASGRVRRAILLLLLAAPGPSAIAVRAEEVPPAAVDCPGGLERDTRCLTGRDTAGAFYVIAVPARWNGTLVLHAHGGPELGAPRLERSLADLARWAVVVKAGYAWAASTYRQGGVEVRAAGEDTERLRRIFVSRVAEPRRTILHGQSWGAGVAAKQAETITDGPRGKAPYDGVLLSSGVLGGGTRAYDFRLDLRVVYQYLCGNHPRADEPAYPLSIGLPANSRMTRAQVAGRIDECLALDRPAEQRTAEQRRKAQAIERVIRIPQSSIRSHLEWGTFHFRDIVAHRTGGASPFGNIGARYTGSDDDDALNAGVERDRADPDAVRRFAEDTDPGGRIPVPVLSVKWIDDPTAFVELDALYASIVRRGGAEERLVQTFTTKGTHSYIAAPVYVTLLEALLQWIDGGTRPTPEGIARRCPAFEATYGPGCTFAPDYVPRPLESRVQARERP